MGSEVNTNSKDGASSARRAIASQMRGGIYVIIDPEHTAGRPVVDIAYGVIRAGAVAIQLRCKNLTKNEVIRQATEIAEACRDSKTIFIVNDYPDIALESDADGVHVGQNDLSISYCRDIMKDTQIVGKSNALVEEALASNAEGADYVAVGSMFETSTKADTRPAGLNTLREVSQRVEVPVVAIGGIKLSNIRNVAYAGADVACVATAVTKAIYPARAVESLHIAFSDELERNSIGKSSES